MALQISPGIDSFLHHKGNYKNLRIGFVTNNAARTSNGILSREALMKNQFNVVKIFSPEHGISVKGDDGVQQQHTTDPATNLSVISLYSEKLGPSEKDLDDVDLVLFDIPDVGCRFYTYLWTMTHVMEACAMYNKPFMLLDRPNPIGAIMEYAEGPMLDETCCSSFIGRWNIPVKHACTLGELATYFSANRMPTLQLEVLKVKNYYRQQTAISDFEFIPTSPAIQNIHAAMLYPGTGLLEGILVNEGRGTDKSFKQCGSPWMQEKELCKALQSKLNHVLVSPVQYVPKAGIFTNELCHGVKFHITSPAAFKAVASGIIILETLFELYPEHIKERLYRTHANPTGEGHLDKLLGYKNSFRTINEKGSFKIDVAEEWYSMMKPFLLYD